MFIYVRHAFSRANKYEVEMFEKGHNSLEGEALLDYVNATFTERDADLADQGIEQATGSAQLFKQWMIDNDITIDQVLISPMMRAIRTASIFLEAIGYQGEVKLVPELQERMQISVADLGTDKTPLLDRIRNSSDLLNGLSIDKSLLTKEAWYASTAETNEEFSARIDAVRQKFIKPAENTAGSITLAFTHQLVGRELKHDKSGIENTQALEMKSDGSYRALYRPPALSLRA